MVLGAVSYRSPDGKVPVALAGRVRVKVCLEGGEVRPGDPLTSSSRPGTAMKAVRPGRVVGMALETYAGSTKEKEGRILMLVNPSWWHGEGTFSVAQRRDALWKEVRELQEEQRLLMERFQRIAQEQQ